MVLPLKQVAGARLGKIDKQSMQIARRNEATTTTNYANSNNGFAGPVVGYSEPKSNQNELEKIRDWQTGGEDFNINKTDKKGIVGERLQPKRSLQNISKTKDQPEVSTETTIEDDTQGIDELMYLNSNPENPNRATERKMLGGTDFLLIIIVTIVKDALDVIIELLEFVFDIFIVTGIFGIILWFVSTIADFTVLLITQGYLMMNDVPMNKKKASVQGLTLLIEAFPFLGILPMNTISMIYMKKLVNRERKQEEVDEQKMLDEQFEMELKNRRDSLNQRLNQTRRTTTIENSQNKGVSKKPEKENEWNKMVEGSNQNITKENPKLK